MPNLYIIAGCNGAGKTTASFAILPEILDCREFVNADIIAADLSPLNPEHVALEAGRIMLQKIHFLIKEKVDFAFETTLATRSCVSLIKTAKTAGYTITLLYFWLNSPELAKIRVAKRVKEGGHSIPPDVIERRYYRVIMNLMNLYIPVCDNRMIVNNMEPIQEEIELGGKNGLKLLLNCYPGMQSSINLKRMGTKEKELRALSEKVMRGLKTGMFRPPFAAPLPYLSNIFFII
ncbi:zeta toxin family protein [Chitinophaga sp. 22321]|uniref:Zeta toxin family protein n=1 Tax=Chitinophaga hostae TaxID=2831022 RepID=A0ABS5J8K0_9BACT|nr:zeta toxin family protein [Chitinophaga hostae]MBS0031529.1 zeta toxin family protein [Chitinophaga hostae]